MQPLHRTIQQTLQRLRHIEFKRLYLKALAALSVTCLLISTAYATTADGMPWDTPGQAVQGWLTGSVAKIVATVLIALTGILFAHGEHGSAFRRFMGIVFGISIAIGAATIYTSLGFSGAEV